MSGPKRGKWTYFYDPTPQRLADLDRFAARLRDVLAQEGEFLARYCSEDAMARLHSAYGRVQEGLHDRDPDSGFDAYGRAWETFRDLRQQAVAAKRQEEHERRLQQQEAAALVAECRSAWRSSETQDLLRRWTGARALNDLAARLDQVAALPASRVAGQAKAWLADLERAVNATAARAQRNAQAVRAAAPGFYEAVQSVGRLHVSALPEEEQREFQMRKDRLRRAGEQALSNENLAILQSAIQVLGQLVGEYAPRIKAAEFAKASEAWRMALANCGYDVVARTEPDGTVVLQATGFPMKSATVELSRHGEQVKLHVGDAHHPDHTRCVTDVAALQAELGREGLAFTVTDWGSGQPGSALERTALQVRAGGLG